MCLNSVIYEQSFKKYAQAAYFFVKSGNADFLMI